MAYFAAYAAQDFTTAEALDARAAAFEHRVAALVLDDGIYDFHAAFAGDLPPCSHGSTRAATTSPSPCWRCSRPSAPRSGGGCATGRGSSGQAPTLILDAEHDQYLKGQPQLVEKALTGAPTTVVALTESEGAGEHTHAGGLSRAHQTMFDWLDATLTAGPRTE